MSLIGRINAVQLILTLNVLYSLTDKNLSSEERKEKVVLCADNFVDKIVDDQLMQLLIIWTPCTGIIGTLFKMLFPKKKEKKIDKFRWLYSTFWNIL